MQIYRLFSPGLRFCHWVWVTCIVVLFATGLYIGNPMYIGTQGIEPAVAIGKWFSMETIRRVHFFAGFILCSCLLLRFYLLFTAKGDRLFPRFWKPEYRKGLLEVLAYYAMLRRHHRPYLRNPLAGTAYVGALVLMAVEAVTGLAMYSMIRPNSLLAQIFGPVNRWLGNEFATHVVHHVIAWVLILFAMIHVYLVFFTDVKEKNGELSSMVSGRKFFEETPVDLKDL
ncbi:MAG: Ni/Fe-hydrogenase, b-type cytochrome subunit [Negativicutes bacterium]|nr:Ni/Fe-hydrogenase, b-type cytochrome subunit [Negativicutes bacterium]